MFFVDLQCSSGHSFQARYDSAADYYLHLKNSEIICPLCYKENININIKVKSEIAMSRAVEQVISRILSKANKNGIKHKGQFTKLDLIISNKDGKIESSNNKNDLKKETLVDEEGVPYFKVNIRNIEVN